MKRVVLRLLFLCFIPASAQINFTKMNWGDSYEYLKKVYPSINWERQIFQDFIGYSASDSLGGLNAKITYFFVNDQHRMFSYLFTADHVYNNIYYDDFLAVSTNLNKDYAMERKDRWKDTTLKDDISRIGYAILKGDVVIEEKYEDSKILIIHTLLFSDESFRHGLVFASQEYVNTLNSKNQGNN